MKPFPLHRLAREGNLAAMQEALSTRASLAINQPDTEGYTPLIRAIDHPDSSIEIVKLLLDAGADIHHEFRQGKYPPMSVMRFALRRGNPEVVAFLQQRGATIHYQDNNGYRAILDALHGRDLRTDERLLDLLRLLIANEVELNTITKYGESALRILSRIGRFDAVKLLLEAGADSLQLHWNPLLRAIAIGTFAGMQTQVEAGDALEEKDFWDRTAWLLALQTGDLAKATFLYDRGARTDAKGRCGKPALFYAIESRHLLLVRWLLEISADVDQTDDFGQTALMCAVELNELVAVDELLAAGADLHREHNGGTALGLIQSAEMGHRLLAAGADPQYLSHGCQRILLGLKPISDEVFSEISLEDFRQGKARRFGMENPERFHDKFCEDMIRSGRSGYEATHHFEGPAETVDSPVWCAQRFGQSITFLPDRRIVQIGGEHEDSYDPDFCIYNDVFVHHPGGAIDLLAYPQTVFPPTDFHTANLTDDGFIWIIGSLGYMGARRYGNTPVYRLDTSTMKVEEVETTGENPGWIYKHRTITVSAHKLRVSGGLVVTTLSDLENHAANSDAYVLDIAQLKWRKSE